MFHGALVTLQVAVLSMVLGIAFAVLIAVARMSANRAARGSSRMKRKVAFDHDAKGASNTVAIANSSSAVTSSMH